MFARYSTSQLIRRKCQQSTTMWVHSKFAPNYYYVTHVSRKGKTPYNYNKGKMSHNLEWKEYDTTHAFPTHHPNIDSRAVLSKFFASKLNWTKSRSTTKVTAETAKRIKKAGTTSTSECVNGCFQMKKIILKEKQAQGHPSSPLGPDRVAWALPQRW